MGNCGFRIADLFENFGFGFRAAKVKLPNPNSQINPQSEIRNSKIFLLTQIDSKKVSQRPEAFLFALQHSLSLLAVQGCDKAHVPESDSAVRSCQRADPPSGEGGLGRCLMKAAHLEVVKILIRSQRKPVLRFPRTILATLHQYQPITFAIEAISPELFVLFAGLIQQERLTK